MSFAGSFSKIPVVKDRLYQGLVGWWRFTPNKNGMIPDYSGKGNHGTIVGDVIENMVGKQGDSIYLQGTDDYVTIPTSPSIELTGDLSICCWVWCEITVGDRAIIAKQAAGASTTAGSYLLYLTRGTIRYGRGGTNTTLQNSQGRISSGKWNHIAISHSGTTARYFINGVFDIQQTINPVGGYVDGGQPLLFGTTQSGSRDYNGMIDDMRLYNRAISDEEVMQIYKIRSTNSGIIGDWLISESSGQVLDRSNFNNHGTIIGATQYYTGLYQIYKALNFDNDNDYIQIQHDYSSLALTRDISITAFIKVNDFNDVNCILSKSSNGVAAPYILNVKSSTGQLRIEVGNGISSDAVDSTDTLVAGRWHSIAVSKSNNTVNFYIDGNSDSGNPHTLGSYTMEDLSTDLLIGIRDDLVHDFNGQIQAVKLFNRALNPTDVEFIHDAADSIGFYDNLEFWYKLDEISGTTLEDYSKNLSNINITSGVTLNQSGHINGAILCGGDASPPVASKSSPTFPTIGTGNFCCIAWIKTTYTGDRQAIFSLNDSNNFSMLINTATSNSRVQVDILGTTYSSSNTGNLADGNWHHVAVVREGTGAGQLRFYIDGELSGQLTSTESIAAVTSIKLGTTGISDFEYFDGYLDDIRFYSSDISQGDILFLSGQ